MTQEKDEKSWGKDANTLVYSWLAYETETATKWLTSLYNRELDLTS